MLFLLGNKGNDPSVSSAASCSIFTLFSCVSCLSWFRLERFTTRSIDRRFAIKVKAEGRKPSGVAAGALNAKTPRREDAKEGRRILRLWGLDGTL